MKRQVLVSDLSGDEIPEGEELRLRVLAYPEPDTDTELDASRVEVENLLRGQGRVLGRRGRKPGRAT